jgi:serine/threonine protein kinase/tetratricopeptide (TPR) repeat protein
MGRPADTDSFLLDQAERWQLGQPWQVETYFARYPELAANAEAALDLIYNEIFLREQHGESPQLEEYLERFPQYAEQLRQQFEVHEVLRDEPRSATVIQELQAAADAGGPEETAPAGGLVPGYEILEELGRGGMGVVYKARQQGLNRLVALKMILSGSQASPRERARFRTEAEAVARLRHPNIIQIYEVNEHAGQLYFSLELAEGGNLSQRIAGTPQAPRPAAELVETLARAVHHAHLHGIVHRDLKPSNILLEKDEGGRMKDEPEGSDSSFILPPSSFRPKVTDFGLAKLLDADLSQTGIEGLVGTPNYMAPEQAAGKAGAASPAVDVYALGAILYELLTGQAPFRGATLLDTIEQVRNQDPVPPRRLLPKLPRDLETVCLKCLEKEPKKRYPSAFELAEDLRRFLAGEPIRARPASLWQHGIKWVWRRPAMAGLVGVSILAGMILVGLLGWHTVDLRAKVDQALADQKERLRLASAGRDAEAQYRTFLRKRDRALLQGIYATHVLEPGQPSDTENVRRLTAEALDEVSGPEGAVELSSYWDDGQKEDVRSGCYELLLILAEMTAPPGVGDKTTAPDRDALRRALAYLDRAARVSTPTRVYHLRRADYLGRLGDPAGAREERAAAGEPTAAVDFFLEGETHYHQGDLQRAVFDLDEALTRKADHFWAQYYRALCHLQLGRYAEAEVGLTASLARSPDFVWTYLMRGFASSELGKLELAEADYHKAEQLHPEGIARYALHVNRASLRIRQQRWVRAGDDLRQAVALYPKQYRAYLYLGLLARAQKDYPTALRQLERATALCPAGPERGDLRAQQADLFYRVGDYRAAVRACDQALADQPGRPEIRGLRGQALVKLGEFAPAVQAFTEYLEHGGPVQAEIYRRRGEAYTRLGNFPAALQDYSVALALQPDAEIYRHRGWAAFFSDAWKPALADFEEALKREPENADARVGRSLARVMLGQYREAVVDAEDVLRHAPTSPETVHNLACVFAQAAGRARADRTADGPSQAVRYQARAVQLLRQALALVPLEKRGAFWRDTMAPDPALDPVRDSAAFQALDGEYARPPKSVRPQRRQDP